MNEHEYFCSSCILQYTVFPLYLHHHIDQDANQDICERLYSKY